MKTLAGITVVQENGIFRVPADLAQGFVLVPVPEGKLNLFFWEKTRMRRYLRNHGYAPEFLKIRRLIGRKGASMC